MAIKKNSIWNGPSNSEKYLEAKSSVPQVSSIMSKSVSEIRRQGISNEVDQGLFRDGSGPTANETNTQNGLVVSSVGQKKFAQVVSSSGNFRGGGGDTVKQTPEVYSPLWLNSNLNLPRDRATINAWCRSFYALNPFVHNAINLHSTYPISKLNIKCPNKEIEAFFNDMIEEIDLMNICVQIAQEYWLLGESFVYSELDESRGKWSRLLIQNPDYMIVKRTVVANEPIIMLRPDENLKKIIFSNKPNDIEQRKQLNSHIIDSVKRGENIPLDNFHVSHLARRISPYEIRGTGLPVCVFRQLMLFDKLRECYDDQTEILTNQGFKRLNEVLCFSEQNNEELKKVKIAFADENDQIFYDYPEKMSIENYHGKLFSVTGKKVDLAVLPSSNLYVKRKIGKNWTDFDKAPAKSLLDQKINYKFNSKAKFNNTNYPETVSVCQADIPIKLYLKVLGYLVSEGCVYSNFKNNRYDAFISVNQLTSSDCYQDMKESFDQFAQLLNKNANHTVKVIGSGYSAECPKEMWSVSIHGKDLHEFFAKEIGTNDSVLSKDKSLPRWTLDLHPELMGVLLNALVKGDGSEAISKYETGSKSFKYSTISKKLSDDVYELVLKSGFVPNICISQAQKSDQRIVTEYIVMWSDTEYGHQPNVFSYQKTGKNGGGAFVDVKDYSGKLLNISSSQKIVSRRNGKVTIQYANAYDENTEILTELGFKSLKELELNNNYVNGVELTNNEVSAVLTMKDDFQVACINPQNHQIEYHKPVELHMSQYQGEMYHFTSRNVDVKVTPNHKMWVQKKTTKNETNWGDWQKVNAKDIDPKTTYRFQGIANFEGKAIDSVNVLQKEVPADLYLKFLGYVISEGYLGQNYIDLVQKVDSDCLSDMKKTATQFAQLFGKNLSEREVESNNFLDYGFKSKPMNRWNGRINSKELMDYFKDQIGIEDQSTSSFKKIPDWVKDLDSKHLSVLLDTLVAGDGSLIKNKKSTAFKYYTVSSQLADDVQEIAFKCNFAPSISTKKLSSGKKQYCVSWSNAADGNYPVIAPSNQHPNKINKVDYEGVVWCLEVPTGLFVTRRNGKIGIQGNSKYAQADNMINPLTLVKVGSDSPDGLHPTFADLEAWRNVFEEAQYDKDFKIFTHSGVAVERVGYGQGIYDISGDISQIIKEIYVGLQVPPVLMDGGADTTYANGGVALDVLRQRYMQFRNMMSSFLKRKIFAPISKIQGFYDYSGGEKRLIVPEVDWNHMSLFDAGDYINTLMTLTQGEGDAKRASLHTLYRSMGLEFEDENRKMRKEAIQNAINAKERESLAAMDLNALRSLDDEDEIPELEKESDSESGGDSLPGEGSSGGLPGLDGGVPPAPPPEGQGPPA